jgi:hypothetical protein
LAVEIEVEVDSDVDNWEPPPQAPMKTESSGKARYNNNFLMLFFMVFYINL